MTKRGIVVRDAVAGDVDRIADWNCRLAEETESRRLETERVRRGVARGLESADLCRYFVAELNGKPVGTTMITYEFTDWRCGVIWWLQSVFVEPAARGQGIFRALFEHISKLARSDGDVRAIRLYVHHDNDRALETYVALGMARAGYEVLEDDWSGAVDPL